MSRNDLLCSVIFLIGIRNSVIAIQYQIIWLRVHAHWSAINQLVVIIKFSFYFKCRPQKMNVSFSDDDHSGSSTNKETIGVLR